MKRIKFSDIFKGNYLSYISNYKRQIQNILNEYDIVIFMARKAICFYESMVTNGEITPTNCEVYSGRIFDYNIIQNFKGKKVAVVDDVVVKGTSLTKVLSDLEFNHIKSFVVVVACDSSLPDKIFENKNCDLCDTYVTLKQQDIYSFAGMITEYIEASMCPFNIDQPIYDISIKNNKTIEQIFYHHHALDISSGLQKKHNIKNKVIYLSLKSHITDSCLNEILSKSILKIRFMIDEYGYKIAIPFVLFPELTDDLLDKMYNLIETETTKKIILNTSLLATRENKLKVVSYCLSEILLECLAPSLEIEYTKKEQNDIFQFSLSTSSLYKKEHLNQFFTSKETFDSIMIDFSKFEFSNLLGQCYNTIIDTKPSKEYHNVMGETINEPIITFKALQNSLMDCGIITSKILASSVIDILIDRGMIVPTIIHKNSTIVRAYKLGEYSKLTRSQIESFAAMLYEYQSMIDCELSKTEFEKLCVLFFNSAINRGIFTQQANYEEDCYSICYSLFGPRISKSETPYNVSDDSVLITDFCETNNGKSIVICKDNKYTVRPISTTEHMKQFATGFAYQYSIIRKLFESTPKHDQNGKTTWNMFVHTYIQYLTLRAIGNNKKSQYLSLCAELYQITKLKDAIFDSENADKEIYKWILRGINSGLWKYWCYINNALDKTTELIYSKDKSAGSFIMMDPEAVFDNNEKWDTLIYEAGKTLFETAFFIKEVLESKHLSYDNESNTDFTNKVNAKIFSKSYYYAVFKDRRHEIEDEVKAHSGSEHYHEWYSNKLHVFIENAKAQLKRCDLILEENSLDYHSVEKLLIIYSDTGEFPDNITNELKEFYPVDLKKSKQCKVYVLQSEKSGVNELTNILKNIDKTSNYSLRYFVFDIGEKYIANSINQTIRGSSLLEIINSTLSQFSEGNIPTDHELVLVTDKNNINSFKHGDYLFFINDIDNENLYKNLINDLSATISNVASANITINVFNIQNAQELSIGGKNMKIVNEGNIGNIIEQHGKNARAYASNEDINIDKIPEELTEKLTHWLEQADHEDKKIIEQAITAANQKDKNKLISLLKKVGKHTISLAENVLGSVIYEWLRANGIV